MYACASTQALSPVQSTDPDPTPESMRQQVLHGLHLGLMRLGLNPSNIEALYR
jgi:hypothetical protein